VSAAPLLEVRDLTVEYSSSGYLIKPLDGLSLEAADGEFVVLLGPSGCGKTTLLSCLAGLLTPTSGDIRFRGAEIGGLAGGDLVRHRRESVGIVFQAFNLVPSLTARENVMAPLILTGTRRGDAGRRADELLDRVGLADRTRHRPADLSGGQQQRVAIARALVHDPPVLLADEPTAHLDHIQVEGVIRLLRELAARGRLVLVSTHDHRLTQIADRVVELAPHELPATERAPETIDVGPGDMIFTQGDYGELVYVVEEGEIEIFRVRGDRSEERVAVLDAGAYFGELGPTLNLPRSASARALTPARLNAYTVLAFRKRPGIAAAPRA
jgi:putative ABC transport system ATP-binding protein